MSFNTQTNVLLYVCVRVITFFFILVQVFGNSYWLNQFQSYSVSDRNKATRTVIGNKTNPCGRNKYIKKVEIEMHIYKE